MGMRIDAASLAFTAAVYALLLAAAFSLYLSISLSAAGFVVVDRLPEVHPDSAYLEFLAEQAQALPLQSSLFSQTPSPSKLNFVSGWNMDALEFDASRSSSSFPAPQGEFKRTNSFYLARDGKPLLLLFTIKGCEYCELQKQAFVSATSRFGEWAGIEGSDFSSASFESEFLSIEVVEVDTAPYPYQPLFMENSPRSKVPLLLLGGIYSRLGGPGSDAAAEEESGKTVDALCMLLSSVGKQPQACAE